MGKCKQCGKNAEGELCFQHKPRKLMRQIFKRRAASKLKAYKGNKDIDKMRNLFISIWNKRSHKSEVSRLGLGREPLTHYFHHILPKSKYPELAYIEENIILLTIDEHANVESDMYKYEEINGRREQLINKYINNE